MHDSVLTRIKSKSFSCIIFGNLSIDFEKKSIKCIYEIRNDITENGVKR